MEAIAQPCRQHGQDVARIDMHLVLEKQGAGMSARQIGFEDCDLVRRQDLVPLGAAGEAVKIGAVTRRGQDQTAASEDGGTLLLPPVSRRSPPFGNFGWGTFPLAAGSEHAARQPGTGIDPKTRRTVENRNVGTSVHQFNRAGEADDAGPDHPYLHDRFNPPLPPAGRCRRFRGTSQPYPSCRPCAHRHGCHG